MSIRIKTWQYATRKIAALCALLVVVVMAAPWQNAGAATPLMLPGGELDPNSSELRLWLRADSGIEDTQGRGPADPDFNGRVAAWKDRSPCKFDLTSSPERAPLFVGRQPAAGNRPTVAFSGEQLLTRTNSALHDRPISTVILVVRGQRTSSNVYSAGKRSARETLRLACNDESLGGVSGTFMINTGERGYDLRLGLPSDGRSGGRFAAIISNGGIDRRSLEFHDGLGDLLGSERPTILAPLASDKCTPDFFLGGDEQEFFCGEVAEMIVFHRGLSPAERRSILNYLRRRYELDMTDGLFPTGTFLLLADYLEGNWTWTGRGGECLRNRIVSTDGQPGEEDGIISTIYVPHNGTYHVWVRATESSFRDRGPSGSALKTIIQGKELQVTHVRGQGGLIWRKAGEVELSKGPAEIVVRGEGPGRKDCDAVLVSPTAATPDAVDEICALAQRIRNVGGESRLTAVFADGLRLDGSLLRGWRWLGPSGQIAHPDPAAMPALVCLQFDRRQTETERSSTIPSESVLEFLNDDRLRGTICGYVPATSQAGQTAQLLIRPPAGTFQDPKQTISVEIDWLRRIVFEPSPRGRRCPPKTLICRDGRVYPFRSIRWGAESVSVLTEESLARIPLNDIAELQMPAANTWETYFRELSILDPLGNAGIVRVETNDGIVLTTSTSRSSQFRLVNEAVASQRLMQPAWSRAPIPVRWSDIRLLWQAPSTMVSLSRFSPEQVTQQGALGKSWKWQADRNVAGGILRSDGLDYIWGFGVHAPNEMVFSLPDCVRAFRARVGIDEAVGNTGRAIAKVYANQASSSPLFQSNPLSGSGLPVSTGDITLPSAAGAARKLVLVTENANESSAEADGLDIGNHVDWLEPILLLDPAKLNAEVRKQSAK